MRIYTFRESGHLPHATEAGGDAIATPLDQLERDRLISDFRAAAARYREENGRPVDLTEDDQPASQLSETEAPTEVIPTSERARPQETLEVPHMNKGQWDRLVGDLRNSHDLSLEYLISGRGFEPAHALLILAELKNQGIIHPEPRKSKHAMPDLYAVVQPNEYVLRELSEGKVALGGLKFQTKKEYRKIRKGFLQKTPWGWDYLGNPTLRTDTAFLHITEDAAELPEAGEAEMDARHREVNVERARRIAKAMRRGGFMDPDLALATEGEGDDEEGGDSSGTRRIRRPGNHDRSVRASGRRDDSRPGTRDSRRPHSTTPRTHSSERTRARRTETEAHA